MKNTLKLCMISLLVLAAVVALSCTDGTFDGKFGEGNLNIVNIPSKYNGKWCAVTGGFLSFDPATPRIQIKSGAVRAPLHSTSGKYEGYESLNISVTLYETETATETMPNLENHPLGQVKFEKGGGVVNWKEPPAPATP